MSILIDPTHVESKGVKRDYVYEPKLKRLGKEGAFNFVASCRIAKEVSPDDPLVDILKAYGRGLWCIFLFLIGDHVGWYIKLSTYPEWGTLGNQNTELELPDGWYAVMNYVADYRKFPKPTKLTLEVPYMKGLTITIHDVYNTVYTIKEGVK